MSGLWCGLLRLYCCCDTRHACVAGCAVYAEAPLAYQAAGDEAWDHALGFGKRYATAQLHDPCAALQCTHQSVGAGAGAVLPSKTSASGGTATVVAAFLTLLLTCASCVRSTVRPKPRPKRRIANCNTCNSAFWRQVAWMALLHSVRELPLQPCYCHGNSLKVTCCVLGYGGSPPTHLACACPVQAS